MTLLSLVLIGTGCEDKIDSSVVNPSEGKTVEVTLNIGIADEEDGTGASASPTSKAGSSSYSGSAFEVVSVADVQTKSGTDIPDLGTDAFCITAVFQRVICKLNQ